MTEENVVAKAPVDPFVSTFKVDGKFYDVPDTDVEVFKANMPNAEKVFSFKQGESTYDVPETDASTFINNMPDAKPERNYDFSQLYKAPEPLQNSANKETPSSQSASKNENPAKGSFGGELVDQTQSGGESIVAAAYGVPGYVYDFIGAGFRSLGVDVPAWKDSWAKPVKVGDTDINPLSLLEKSKNGLLQAAKVNDQEVRKANPDIERGVIEPWGKAVKNMDANEAITGFRNMFSSIAQSAPASAAMIASGGLSTAAQVGAGAALFGSQNINQADTEGDYGKVSRDALLAISSVTGALESVFETSLGSGAVGKAVINIVQQKGKKAAEQEIKKEFLGSMSKMLIENPWMTPFGEAFEEMGTQLSQNAVNKYTGYKPDINITDGVIDAGLIGFGMGSVHGGIIKGAKMAFNSDQKGQSSTPTQADTSPIQETPLPTIDPRSIAEQQAREFHQTYANKETGILKTVFQVTPDGEQNIPWNVTSEWNEPSPDGKSERRMYLAQTSDGQYRQFEAGEIVDNNDGLTEDDFAAQQAAVYDQQQQQLDLLKNNQMVYDGQKLTRQENGAGLTKDSEFWVKEDGSGTVEVPLDVVNTWEISKQSNPTGTPDLVTRTYGKTQVSGTRDQQGNILLSEPMGIDQVDALNNEVEKSTGGKATVITQLIPNEDTTQPEQFQVSITRKDPATEAQRTTDATPLVTSETSKQNEKPVEPEYIFKGNPISKEEAHKRVDKAILLNNKAVISDLVHNDPKITEKLNKKFPVPVPEFTINGSKVKSQQALDFIEVADDMSELEMLKHKNIESDPIVFQAYQDKIKSFIPVNVPENVNISEIESVKVPEIQSQEVQQEPIAEFPTAESEQKLQELQNNEKESLQNEDSQIAEIEKRRQQKLDHNNDIELARSGDEKTIESFNDYGLDYEKTTLRRFVSKGEVESVLNGDKQTGRFKDGRVDVTSQEEPTTAATGEYRITFNDSFDFNNGGRATLKNRDLGDGNLKDGYTIDDVLKIEKKNEDGSYTSVYEGKNKSVEEHINESHDAELKSLNPNEELTPQQEAAPILPGSGEIRKDAPQEKQGQIESKGQKENVINSNTINSINQAEIKKIQDLISDPNQDPDQKEYWKDDIVDLQNNPQKYWKIFQLSGNNSPREQHIKAVKDYYSPEPQSEGQGSKEIGTAIANQQPNLNPTEAQKESGNYKKAHVKIQGMDISIENPIGSVRKGKDEDGKAWEHTMKSHYGYFKNTVGKDRDHIDTFVGPNPESAKVFVIDQINPKTGAFDESKVMLGYNDVESARQGYLENYDKNWKGLSAITEVEVEPFKKWLLDGFRQRKPFSEYKETPAPVFRNDTELESKIKSIENDLLPTNHPLMILDKSSNQFKQALNEYLKEKEAKKVVEQQKPVSTYGQNNKVVTQSRYEELKKLMKDELNTLNSGFNPKIFTLGAEMAAFHIESGARKFSEYAKNMVSDLGEGIKPYLKQLYNGVRDFPGMEDYESSMDSYEDVKKTDVEAALKDESNINTEENEPEIQAIESQVETITREREVIESATENVTDSQQAGEIAEQIRETIEKIDEALNKIQLFQGAYSTDNIDHELPNMVVDKIIKKDVVKYSKALAKSLGYEHDTDRKGKADYGNVNLPPAGGEATFILWLPATEYGVYVSIPYHPDYKQGYDNYKIQGMGWGSDPILWRITSKEKKYTGFGNQYAKGNITVGEFAEKIQRAMRQYVKPAEVAREVKAENFINEHFVFARPVASPIEQPAQKSNEIEPGDRISLNVMGMVREGIVLPINPGDKEGLISIRQDNGKTLTGWSKHATIVTKGENTKNTVGNLPENDVILQQEVTPQQDDTEGLREDVRGTLQRDETGLPETNNEGGSQGVQGNSATQSRDGLDVGQDVPGEGNGNVGDQRTGEGISGPSRGTTNGNAERNVNDGDRRNNPNALRPVKNANNLAIAPGEQLAPRGDNAKIKANIEAIKVAKKLFEKGQTASPAQMNILKKYTGWGGLSSVFKYDHANFQELKDVLTPQEYKSARESTTTAFFTPPEVISDVWGMIEKLGFKGGNVLEPSSGIGHFFGLMPESIKSSSDLRAIELDNISGMILNALYPDAKVSIEGFEDVQIPNNSLDLVVTNVPFGQIKLFDKNEKDLSSKFNIHDFFIAKSVRKLKPGGIGVFITTTSTMDRSEPLRRWLAFEGNADVIDVFRLNTETFKASSGTEASSDIIIVRKRDSSGKSPFAKDVLDAVIARQEQYTVKENWNYVEKTATMFINKFFADNPDKMAGEMKFGFEGGNELRPTEQRVAPVKGKNQAEMLENFKNQLPNNIYDQSSVSSEQKLYASDELKEGELHVVDGIPYIVKAGLSTPVDWNSNKVAGYSKTESVTAYAAIKKAINSLIEAESTSANNIEALRKELNRSYDNFVSKFGTLNNNTKIGFLEDDLDFPSVSAIENVEEKVELLPGAKKSEKYIVSKSDIFSKRVIGGELVDHAETVDDAIKLSRYRFGSLNTSYAAGLLKMDEQQFKDQILSREKAFENPVTGIIEPKEEYLSGNVVEKLKAAEQANENGKYDGNINQLKTVIPTPVPLPMIKLTLGSSWVPVSVYNKFFNESFDVNSNIEKTKGGRFIGSFGREYNDKNRTKGMETVLASELAINAMNNKQTVIYRSEWVDGKRVQVKDVHATAQASAKQVELSEEFEAWVKKEGQPFVEELEIIYNETFNAVIERKNDVEGFKTFPNATETKIPRQHQKEGVIRSLEKATLLAHEVGTGKTITLITTAMEMRRLGLAKKPVIVVQRSTYKQFVNEIKSLYPGAKVLVPSAKDLTGAQREQLLAKIAYNDWDIVVLYHSYLDSIPDDPSRVASYIQEQIDEKLEMLEELKGSKADGAKYLASALKKQIESLVTDRNTAAAESIEANNKKEASVKQKEKTRKNAETRAKTLVDRRTDNVMFFEQLGVDALLVDEAHAYKKLGFNTNLQGVKGVDQTASKRAQSLRLKSRYILDNNNGKNVVLATGTPISNTMAEMWTFLRFLLPKEELSRLQMNNFDQFVNNFGEIEESAEFSTSGKFKVTNRFSKYTNIPELQAIWKQVAHTVLTEEVSTLKAGVGTPNLTGDKPQDIFLPQTNVLKSVMRAIKAEIERFENMSGREKKENSHIPLVQFGLAKQAAIDVRLVNSNLNDDPGSKLNETVRVTLKQLEETKSYNGTVAIFCDSYQSRDKKFNVFEDIKKKLIENGTPETQIAIINDYNTDEKKDNLFKKVNSGMVRVVLGTTERLGVGVNIQERLNTLIHMDAPIRPSDYMQRNGRILRQGNLHLQMGIPVNVIRIGVEKTLDVTGYQRLKIKEDFIKQIMKSEIDPTKRDITEVEVDNVDASNFSHMMASLSGSQSALALTLEQNKLRKLRNAKDYHASNQNFIAKKIFYLKNVIPTYDPKILEKQKEKADIQAEFKGDHIKNLKVGKTETSNPEEFEALLLNIKKDIEAAKTKLRADQVNMNTTIPFQISLNGVNTIIKVVLKKDVNVVANTFRIETNIDLLHKKMEVNIGPYIERLIEKVDYKLSGQGLDSDADYLGRMKQADIKSLDFYQKEIGKPFDKEDQLAKSEAEIERLNTSMREELAAIEAQEKAENIESANLDGADELETDEPVAPKPKGLTFNSEFVNKSVESAKELLKNGTYTVETLNAKLDSLLEDAKDKAEIRDSNENKIQVLNIQEVKRIFSNGTDPQFSALEESNIDEDVKPIIQELQDDDPEQALLFWMTPQEMLSNFKKRLSPGGLEKVKSGDFQAVSVGGMILLNKSVPWSKKAAINTWAHERLHIEFNKRFKNQESKDTELTKLFNEIGKAEINRVLPEFYKDDSNEVRADEYLAHVAGLYARTGKFDSSVKQSIQKLVTDLFDKFTTPNTLQNARENRVTSFVRSGNSQGNQNNSVRGPREGRQNSGTQTERENDHNRSLRQDRTRPLSDLLRQAKENKSSNSRSQESNNIQFSAKNTPLTQLLKEAKDKIVAKKAANPEKVRTAIGRFRSLWQDSRMPVLNLQTKFGLKVSPYTNVAWAMNQKGSKAMGAAEKFEQDNIDPVEKAIHEMTKLDKKLEEISVYIQAKHAPERNETFSQRDMVNQADVRGMQSKLDDLKEKQKNALDQGDTQLAAIFEAKVQQAKTKLEELKKSKFEGVDKDDDNYSGYTTNEATAITEAFESDIPQEIIDQFWTAWRAANKARLQLWKDYGRFDQRTIDAMQSNGWQYYAPLVGWEKDLEAIELDYQKDSGGEFVGAKKAQGRRSKADDPIANMITMAHSAILWGEKNKVKQNLYSLIKTNPGREDLFDMSQIYFMTDKNGITNEVVYDKAGMYEDENGNEKQDFTISTIEIQDGKFIRHEIGLKSELENENSFDSKMSTQHLHGKSRNKSAQHEVDVFIEGKSFKMILKDPAIANTINGADMSKRVPVLSGINRWRSKTVTTWAPIFTIRNQWRDYKTATKTVFIEDGLMSSLKFNKYYGLSAYYLVKNLNNVTPSSPEEVLMKQYYDEYRLHGSRTGHSYLQPIDEVKSKLLKKIKELNQSPLRKGMKFVNPLSILDLLEITSSYSESVSRFARYIQQREAGLTIPEATSAAKEVTTNFDTKGTIAPLASSFIMFFNPAVQGATRQLSLAKHHPMRYMVSQAFGVAQGIMFAMLWSLMNGDDDDKDKREVSEYTRRTNTVIGFGEHYVVIPLAQGYRLWNSIGSIAYEVYMDKMSTEEAAQQTFKTMMDSFSPVDAAKILDKDGVPDFAKTIGAIFNAAQPITDIAANENFMNLPITREAFTKSLEGKVARSQMYKHNVNYFLKSITDSYFKLWGGDPAINSRILPNGKELNAFQDVNPSQVEHFIKGYTGVLGANILDGIGTIAKYTIEDAEKKVSEADYSTKGFDWNQIPIVYSFYKSKYAGKSSSEFRELSNKAEDLSYVQTNIKKTYGRNAEEDLSLEDKNFVKDVKVAGERIDKRFDRLNKHPELADELNKEILSIRRSVIEKYKNKLIK